MIARVASALFMAAVIAAILIVVPNLSKPEDPALAEALQTESALFAALAEFYPDEYAALVDDMQTVADQPTEVTRVSAEGVTAFRLAHADELLAASDDALRTYVSSMRDTHSAVKETFGPERCNQYAVYGAGALGPFISNPDILPWVNAQGAAMVEAFASAAGGDARPEASDEDWAALIGGANTSDETQAYVDLISATDSEAEQYCEAMLWLLETIATTDSAAAETVRASFAKTISSS